MKRSYLQALLRKDQTVFSFKDLLLEWAPVKRSTAEARIAYYVKTGALYHIRRGLYGKDKGYSRHELANKIYKPSYISFETVTAQSGMTFQYYSTIFLASYVSRDINCDGQNYSFKKMRNDILADSRGVEIRKEFSIATPERAFLDILYRSKDYYFDNLGSLDWNKVTEILPLYRGGDTLTKKVEKYRQHELQK